MRRRNLLLGLSLAAAVIVQTVVTAQKPGEPVQRARPPEWNSDVLNAFFADAREKLPGERPNLGIASATRPMPDNPASSSQSGPDESGSIFAWSKLISATSLEDEVKRYKLVLDQVVTTPGPFKGGGNREARVHFSTLALVFAIIGEFDGDVRWKDEAPDLRGMFAQAGFSCKVGTDQSYNQSKLRLQDLADLVRGESVSAAKSDIEREAKWDKVADRPPLMSRLEIAFDKRLSKMAASKALFEESIDEVRREAEIIAAIGEVIQREGYEYAGDEDYLQHARRMRDAGVQIREAIKTKDYGSVENAVGEIRKACTNCHESYRG